MLFPILKSIAEAAGATVGDGAAGSSEPQAQVASATRAMQIAETFFSNDIILSRLIAGGPGANSIRSHLRSVTNIETIDQSQ